MPRAPRRCRALTCWSWALVFALAAGSAAAGDAHAAAAATTTPAAAPSPAAPIVITEKSFKCIREMAAVRGFFVDNLAGDLAGTLKIANAPSGGVYPPGSVVQLFPNEVMVKRESGFNPATHDWEFFELDVSAQGSTIRTRGFVDVKNRFGGNCFACHVQAKPEWDFICEQNHGCENLPVSRFAITALQHADPRCDNRETPLRYRATNWLIRFFSPL